MKDILLIIMLCFSVAVKATVHADFTPDKAQGCPPLLVNFTNLSAPANAGFRWDFGNGNSSTLANPSAMFLNSGNYRVKLMVTYAGVTDTISKIITVHNLPVVNFTAPVINLCSNDTARFLANVTPGDAVITDYAWGFGDGIASSDTNSSHLYNGAGTYDITLVVQDANGCSANATKHNYIQVFAKPDASFVAVPAVSCNYSDTIRFTNNSTGNGLTYLWKLDDNFTSTDENPVHLYEQEKKKVVLIVTDQNGCVDSAGVRVSVTDLQANFVANKTQACAGESIKFTNTSNFPGSSRLWDFGDGTTSTSATPTKVYNTPGVYTVTLILRDGPCTDTFTRVNYITIVTGFAVSFSADAVAGCEAPFTVNFTNNTPGGATYNWTFGDGTTSSDENPTKTFTSNGSFSVSLTVTDSTGCSVTGVVPAMVNNSLPRPRFKGDTVGCPGNAMRFFDNSVAASSYLWSFGDGDTSTLKNPYHTFAQVGDYDVTLTAYNSQGCDSSITKRIHIDNVLVDFAVNQTFSPCPPFVAVFSSTANKPNLKYTWDFGDGGVDTAANPTHIYFYPGVYTVKLIAKTTYGCTDTVIYTDLIVVQGPSGVFAVNPTEGCLPLNVSISAVVSSNTLSFWSDLGDGRVVSDSLAFAHTYTQVDSFHPKFILLDHIGCMVSYDLPVIVTHTAPQLQLNDTTVCPGSVILVEAGNDDYQWVPSANLSCDTCASVVINPMQSVTYRVTATNEYGCNLVDSLSVNVEAMPVLNASAPVKVCKGQGVNLFAGNASVINWSPATYLSDSTAVSPSCHPLQSTTYTVTGYNQLGCAATTTVEVNVVDKVEVAATGDKTLCAGDTVQLNSQITQGPDSGVALVWSPAAFVSQTDVANPVAYVQNQSMTFTVVAAANGCASDTAQVTIQVSATPDITVSDDVTTTPGAEVAVYAASHSTLSYSWSAIDSISCGDCRRTSVFPTQSQTVYVTGTNQFGCSVTDSLNIHVVSCDPNSVYLPNTFTPNGDGSNDRMFVRSNSLSNLEYFRVFDQWGRLVFETNNVQEGWDGTVNGQPAPLAVYVYVVKGQCQNGGNLLKSENIALMR